MDTMILSVEMVSVSCGECDIIFGMPKQYYNARREDHRVWYCPNGHSRVFKVKSDSEKLRDELAAQKRRTEYYEADAQRAREQRDASERKARAARGVVTRVKNRVGRGVCPCCNRFFECLHRHMQTKHPAYVTSDGEKATA